MIEKLLFIPLFACLMMCVGILKHNNVLDPVYAAIQKKVTNKRLLMTILSGMFGILPVPGRITLATGCFDTCTRMHKNRGQLGILAYLSTHHYYLWSPVEKSVLIVLAGLGLSYPEFIMIMLPYLATLMICTWFYIFFVMDDIDDIVLDFGEGTSGWKWLDSAIVVICILTGCVGVVPLPAVYLVALIYLLLRYRPKLKQLISYIDIKLLAFATIVIATGYLVHTHVEQIHNILGHLAGNYGAHVALLCSFIASFLLGSSSKFAGIVVLLVPVYGIAMLPIFYIVDFCGYLLSPMHKCVLISNRYFKTKFVAFYNIVGIICLILIMQTIINYYI